MAVSSARVELWRNYDGDMIRRQVVTGIGPYPVHIVDNLSLRHRATRWGSNNSAFHPPYSEYDAAKEAARFTDTPFASMRNLLHLQVFSYKRVSSIPVIGVVEIDATNHVESYPVRQGSFDNCLRTFLRWHARQAREGAILE